MTPIARSSGHDVILAVGTRMASPNLLDGQQVVQIDIDADELGRNYDKTFGILGDARRVLEKLYTELLTRIPARPSRRTEIEVQQAQAF